MMHKYPESILLPEPISKIMNWITTFILSNGASLEMSGTTWIISFQEFGLEQSGRDRMCSGDDACSNPSFLLQVGTDMRVFAISTNLTRCMRVSVYFLNITVPSEIHNDASTSAYTIRQGKMLNTRTKDRSSYICRLHPLMLVEQKSNADTGAVKPSIWASPSYMLHVYCIVNDQHF